jgi:hypothetical protein
MAESLPPPRQTAQAEDCAARANNAVPIVKENRKNLLRMAKYAKKN